VTGNSKQPPAQPGESVFAPQVVSQSAVKVVENRHTNRDAGIKTGIDTVDKHLLPMRPGELIAVVGYTSNYKSGLMNYIARYNARELAKANIENQAVITFTWEQSIEEQGIVDISQLTRIDVTRMMRGELDEPDWKLLRKGAIERGTLPWWLIGHSSETGRRRPRLSMTDAARMLEYVVDVQKVSPALVVLDYLQRIRRDTGDTMREGYMDIVSHAKDMALAFHCPVILGSQAGRQAKERANWKLPQLDDGQETSNLEQSADKFISVWMPKNDHPKNTTIEYGSQWFHVTDNLLVLGVMKQKFGPAPRIVQLHVEPEVNEIYPMEKQKL
jgi:replicative DNA helicase